MFGYFELAKEFKTVFSIRDRFMFWSLCHESCFIYLDVHNLGETIMRHKENHFSYCHGYTSLH